MYSEYMLIVLCRVTDTAIACRFVFKVIVYDALNYEWNYSTYFQIIIFTINLFHIQSISEEAYTTYWEKYKRRRQ